MGLAGAVAGGGELDVALAAYAAIPLGDAVVTDVAPGLLQRPRRRRWAWPG